MDVEEELDEEAQAQEDWMQLQQPRDETVPQLLVDQNPMTSQEALEYWHRDDQYYTNEELAHMDTWLLEQKRDSGQVDLDDELDDFEIDSLNVDQRFAYDIVHKYLRDQNQLLFRIEGFAGN
jgi:hypothetical protein